MPEMDGLETTRRIRHPESRVLDRNIPIVAVTANAMRIDRQQCLNCGMNDYLAKPIDTTKLLDTIRKWLPAKHHRQKRPLFSPISRPQPNCSYPLQVNKAL
jgi:CheY-like chemotaxis protein